MDSETIRKRIEDILPVYGASFAGRPPAEASPPARFRSPDQRHAIILALIGERPGLTAKQVAEILVAGDLAGSATKTIEHDFSTLFQAKRLARVGWRYYLPSDPPAAAPPAKNLVPAEVRSLRSKYMGGATQRALAVEFGVSRHEVSAILTGRRYADVT